MMHKPGVWASAILKVCVHGSEHRRAQVSSEKACSGTRSSVTIAERCSASCVGSVLLQFSRVV